MLGRSMMQQMLGDPFEDDPFFRDPFSSGQRGRGGRLEGDAFGGLLSLREGGFGNMMMMGGGSSMGGVGTTFVQSSSFSSDGRNVYSSSTSARMGPGGVAEIQRSVNDGRAGREEIMMERRIGDRGRRVQKTRNTNTGDEETVDNSYGIADGEEALFDRDFQEAAAQRLINHPRAYHGGSAAGRSGPTISEPQRSLGRDRGQHQAPMIGYERAAMDRGSTRQSAGSRGSRASERSRW